jgi:hypothetical protein
MLFTNGRHNRPDEREEGVEWIKHVLWKERKVVVCTNLIWLLLLYIRKRWGISLRFNFKCKKGRMFVTLHTGSASLLFSAPRYETRHGHVTHTPPLYTAHRDTHLSLLGKILPPPLPTLLPPRLFNYSTRCAVPVSIHQKKWTVRQTSVPFIYHFINNRRAAAVAAKSVTIASDFVRNWKERKKSFSLSHNRIDERHFVTEMSTGFSF